MDDTESLELASLLKILDHIAELGKKANAAPKVVADGEAAWKKSADRAISASDYSTKHIHDNKDVRSIESTNKVE